MFIITTVQLNCELQALTLYIYTLFFFNTVFIHNNIVFILEQTVFNVLQKFKLIELSPKLNLVQSYRTFFPYNILYYIKNDPASLKEHGVEQNGVSNPWRRQFQWHNQELVIHWMNIVGDLSRSQFSPTKYPYKIQGGYKVKCGDEDVDTFPPSNSTTSY